MHSRCIACICRKTCTSFTSALPAAQFILSDQQRRAPLKLLCGTRESIGICYGTFFSPRAFPSPPAAVDVAGSMGPADAYAGWIDGAGVVHVVDFSTTADHTINPPARMVAWDRYGYGLVSDGIQGVQCGPSDFRPMPI